MDRVKRHITMGFVLKDRLQISLKLITIGSWKRLLNYNITDCIIEYFYPNVIGMTPLIEKS
jgi:hypothetical protein